MAVALGIENYDPEDPTATGTPDPNVAVDPATTPPPSVTEPAPAPATEPAPTDNSTALEAGAPTSTYDAQSVEMGDEDSVESRIADIISSDSPLMQSAQTAAAQESNSKGLLNSSMAVGAAQKAVIDAATPIAQQDAATAANYNLANQAAGNEAGQFNASETNATASIFNNGIVDMSLLSEQGLIDLQKIDANIEGDFQLLNAQGEIDINMQQADIDATSALEAQKGEIQIELINADADRQLELNAQLAQIAIEQSAIDYNYTMLLDQQAAYIDMALQDAAAEDAVILEQIKGEIDKELEALRQAGEEQQTIIQGDYNIQVAQINGEYQVLLNSNSAAAAASTQYDATAAEIWSNPETSVATKVDLAARAFDDYKESLELISLTGEVDYTDTL